MGRGLVVRVVADELLEAGAAAARDAGAGAHHRVAAALDQVAAGGVALEARGGRRDVARDPVRRAELHPAADVAAGPDEVDVLVAEPLQVHVGELGHVLLAEALDLVAADLLEDVVEDLVLQFDVGLGAPGEDELEADAQLLGELLNVGPGGELRHVGERLRGVVVHQPEGRREVAAGKVELAVEDVADLVVVDLVVGVRPGVQRGYGDGVRALRLRQRQPVRGKRPVHLPLFRAEAGAELDGALGVHPQAATGADGAAADAAHRRAGALAAEPAVARAERAGAHDLALRA